MIVFMRSFAYYCRKVLQKRYSMESVYGDVVTSFAYKITPCLTRSHVYCMVNSVFGCAFTFKLSSVA